VQLDFLVDAQAVEQEVRQAVAAARPRLDADLDAPRRQVARGEADPPCLEMSVERDEAESVQTDLDGAHGAVPGTGHADRELVADAQLALLAAELHEARQRRGGGAVRFTGEGGDELGGRQLGLAHACHVRAVHERTDAVLHALQVAVVGARRRWRHVGGHRAWALKAVHRRRAPQVVPAGLQDAGWPASGGRDAPGKGEAAGHRRH